VVSAAGRERGAMLPQPPSALPPEIISGSSCNFWGIWVKLCDNSCKVNNLAGELQQSVFRVLKPIGQHTPFPFPVIFYFIIFFFFTKQNEQETPGTEATLIGFKQH